MPHPSRRCTRPSKGGAECRSARIGWWRSEVPNPQSCISHLTPAERVEHAEIKRRNAEETLQFYMRVGIVDGRDPACWSWEPPTPSDLQRLKDSYSAAVRARLSDEDFAAIQMSDWHQGRCAICGDRDELVNDHDHQTGLERGRLCRSCNTCEGTRRGGVWDKYRQRNPASILGVKERYWSPITGYAEKAPEFDPWVDNPLNGLL